MLVDLLGAVVFPPPIGIVPCACLQDTVGDRGDIPCNMMSCIVLGNTSGEQCIIVLPDWILAMDRSHGCSLIHRFECPIVLWCATTVTSAAAQLLVLDETAVTPVLTSAGEASGIDDGRQDFHGANLADAGHW